MGNKIVIFMDGVPDGKTALIEAIKADHYWIWNINFRNLLAMIAHKLFWEGNRNDKYYEFLDKLENLSIEYFDSENIYLNNMVNKFLQNEKPQILIIHNGKLKTYKEFSAKYANVYNIFISEDNLEKEEYRKTFNSKDKDYIKNSLNYIKTLLGKDISNNNG